MKRLLSSLLAVLLGVGVLLVGAGAAWAGASDGSRDTAFAPTGVSASVLATAVDAQGRVVVAGNFTTAEGAPRGRIARYLADGTLDTTFATGTGFNSEIDALAIDVSGTIILGGSFTSYNGTTGVNRIARLTPTGALDTTFVAGAGFNRPVLALAIDGTGNIIVGGSFTTYDGTTGVNRIARLTSTGALDTAFTTGSGTGFAGPVPGTGGVSSLAIDRTGNILAGGFFATYNGVATGNIARLSPSGALDTTLATGTGFDGNVNSLAIDSTGNIIAGGDFTTYDGTAANSIARLTPSGALDTTLATGTGFDTGVYSLGVDSAGNILAGGVFTTYNGATANRIARLTASVALSYDVNGGVGTAPAAQPGRLGSTPTVAAGTGLTRTGYTFAGWNTAADGSGTALTPGATYTLTRNTTAYARWTTVPAAGPATSSITLLGGTGSLAANAPVSVTATGLQPGSAWTITMHSTPVVLATGTTPANGNLQASATLPASVTPGVHRLVLTATAADGTPLTTETSFRVDRNGVITGTSTLAATGNDDAIPLIALGAVLLLTGTAAVLAGRRRPC